MSRAGAALSLAVLALAPPQGGSEGSLVELLGTPVELELARIPDTDVLCAAGGVVRFRLARDARVSLTVAGEAAGGTVDGGPAVEITALPLRAGVHEIVVSAARRNGLATGERPFTLAGLEPGAARPAEVTGTLRDERIDRAVLPVGRTFVTGVDLLDGHLVLQATDLKVEGRHIGLELTRTYSSAGRSAAGLVGAGWRLNYESALTPLPECGLALVRTADGGTQTFLGTSSAAGPGFRPQRGYHSRLQRNPDGSFDFFDKAANRHHFAERAAGTAASLRLDWIEEPHGDRLALAYDAVGRLHEVSERHPRLGPVRTIVFRYTSAGGAFRIASAQAWGLGLRVDFRYDASGNLASAEQTDREKGMTTDRYEYSVSDPRDPHQLVAVTPHGEARTTYAYGPPPGPAPPARGPVGPVEPRELVRAADPAPGGHPTTFTYDPSGAGQGVFRTEVRAAGGSVTRYVLNGDGNPLEIDEPAGLGRTVTKFTWDPAHVVKTAEDNNHGRHLTYGHDPAGNLTLELDVARPGAPVRKTVYAYDPRFNKLVHKEDADGRRSAWTLDPETGDLLREDGPDGKPKTWAYDREGCLDEQRNAGGRTLYRRPDTFCNATEVKAPDGSVNHRRFDARGRLMDETKTPPR